MAQTITLIIELVVMEIACMEPDQNYYYPGAVGTLFTVNFCLILSFFCWNIIYCLIRLQLEHNFLSIFFLALSSASVGIIFTVYQLLPCILLQLGHLLSTFALYPAAFGTLLITMNIFPCILLQLEHYLLSIFTLVISCCSWNFI